jgi:hypothetical protein
MEFDCDGESVCRIAALLGAGQRSECLAAVDSFSAADGPAAPRLRARSSVG